MNTATSTASTRTSSTRNFASDPFSPVADPAGENQTTKTNTSMSIKKNALLPAYIAELRKSYPKDDQMVNWIVSNTQSLVMLPSGHLFTTSKETIRTEFCFGYSSCGQGPDYNEMLDAWGEFTRNPYPQFLAENTSHLESQIDRLTTAYPDRLFIYPIGPRNVYGWQEVSPWRDWEKYPGAIPMTEADKAVILDTLRNDMLAMTKRCESWFKRYGKDKLRSWSYRIDE